MRITDLKLYYVPHRFLFLKIETDEGISGWGEPIIEGRAATLEASVNEWRNFLIGRNPLLIEDIWQSMYRCAFYRGGPILMSTIAGINQALWDIKGKYYNAPVYELLGGAVKDKVKVYRSIQGDSPEELARDAKKAVFEEGYKLVKSCPIPISAFVDDMKKVDHVIEMVTAIKDAVGDKADIAIDFHGRLHRPMAKIVVHELDKLGLLFLEEPILPTNKEVLKEFSKWCHTPIAQGERIFSRWEFKDLLADGCTDIVQPDLSHAGGISEGLRIAAMAEAYDVAFAPHCPLSVISFASCIQLDTCTPTAVFQEQSINVHNGSKDNLKMRFLKDPGVFRYEDGFVLPPSGPGLGIEIDEELVKELNADKHDWKNPMERTFDGTPIEW